MGGPPPPMIGLGMGWLAPRKDMPMDAKITKLIDTLPFWAIAVGGFFSGIAGALLLWVTIVVIYEVLRFLSNVVPNF